MVNVLEYGLGVNVATVFFALQICAKSIYNSCF